MSHRKLSRSAIVRAFSPSHPKTLLDVKQALRTCTDVPARRIADDISALNTLGNAHRLAGEDGPNLALARIDADPRVIAKYLNINPAALSGMKKASRNNLRSRLRHALRKTGAGPRVANRIRPLSPLWEPLFAKLPALPYRAALSSFVRFLDDNAIEPKSVTSEHLKEFGERLDASGMRRRPRQTMLSARNIWNSAARLYPEFWPNKILEANLRFNNRYSLPLSAFADSFSEEVSLRTATVIGPSLEDEDAPPAIRKCTAIANEYDMRRFASALVLQTGRDPKSIKSISDLVQVDAVKAILQFLLGRVREKDTAAQTSSGIHVASQLLCGLARNWVKVDEDHLKRLRKISNGRAPSTARGQRKRRRGMTKKNREMLNQFRDERTVEKFLDLPESMFTRLVGKKPLRRVDAAKLSACFAISLLQIAPVRPKNGAGIKLGQNLIEMGRGASRRVFVEWSPEEVKNGVELHFELTGLVLELFDLYSKFVRPRLCGADNLYLFPGRGSGPKDESWFSTQIAQLLRDEIGVRVTGQQFRHLMGSIHLTEHPGDYETVREFLGHSDIRTTVDFYAEMQMEDAAKTLDAVVTKRRSELSNNVFRPRRWRIK